ncbi:MAG TPA: M28 family peptidase, partial [Candidatus Eisenbacteria bacterium]
MGIRSHAPVVSGAALLAALLFAVPAPAAPDSTDVRTVDPSLERVGKEGLAGIEVLAAPAMEGRGVGTRGIRLAADWIEEQLKADGLKPAFGKSYRQKFRIKTGVSLAKRNFVQGVADSDWVPLGFSSSGRFDGEIAFLGYGIQAPPMGYDELSGLDLHGKIALMLRYEPQEKDEHSPFDGRKPSRWSALRYKTLKARELGAVCVVFVTGPLQDEGKDKLPPLANDGPESPAGLPVIQVRASVAQRWLAPLGIDLAEFQRTVDRDLAPRTRPSTGVRLQGNIALEATYAVAENVAGLIPGDGALAHEVVVVGAHYDHLGYGGRGSMRPNEHAIHPGADDNASGTVSVLLAARQLKRDLAREPSHRAVIAVLFSGEEVGLAGSSWFVQHPPFPMGTVAAMVNLDMVGRLRNGRLIALGSDTA